MTALKCAVCIDNREDEADAVTVRDGWALCLEHDDAWREWAPVKVSECTECRCERRWKWLWR